MKVCPTCKRPFPQRGRICAICDKPILRHDRWHFEGSTVQHNDCEDPHLAKQQINDLPQGLLEVRRLDDSHD